MVENFPLHGTQEPQNQLLVKADQKNLYATPTLQPCVVMHYTFATGIKIVPIGQFRLDQNLGKLNYTHIHDYSQNTHQNMKLVPNERQRFFTTYYSNFLYVLALIYTHLYASLHRILH